MAMKKTIRIVIIASMIIFMVGTIYAETGGIVGSNATSVLSTVCYDSDGGKILPVAGTVSGSIRGVYYTKKDSCFNNTILTEYSCLNNVSYSYNYDCPTYGYNACLDGVCVKTPTNTTAAKEYVTCLFEGSNKPQSCYTDKYSCSGINNCSIAVYGTKGQQLTWKSSCGGYAHTTIDYQDEKAYFKCQTTCTDSDGGENYYLKGVSKGQYQGGPPHFIFGIPPEPLAGGKVTNDSYTTYYDHCANDKQLNEGYCENNILLSRGYSCPNGCKDGACLNTTKPTNNTCTDSDGGKNYYLKGVGTGYYDDLIHIRSGTDFCVSSNPDLLGEQYCDGAVLRIVNYPCQYGCKDGACIKANITCSDTDGGMNYLVKGACTDFSGTHTDGCSSPTSADDWYCAGGANGNCAYTGLSCSAHFGNNYVCKDGACLKEPTDCPIYTTVNLYCPNGTIIPDGVDQYGCQLPPKCAYTISNTTTCTDSDGNNIYIAGNYSSCVFNTNGGGCGGGKEMCLNSNILFETYCSGNDLKTSNVTCPYGCLNGACIKSSNNTNTTVGCSQTFDNICPSGCSLGVDADCCKNSNYYWLKTSFGYGCYKTDYNPGCSPGVACSGSKDSCCPNWCAAGTDYDCCLNSGYCWNNGTCGTCPAVSCTDSDGGRDYYVSGYIDSSTISREYDLCYTDGITLKEKFCDNGGYNAELFKCPYGCKDGACIKTPTDCPIYTTEMPYCPNGTIIPGKVDENGCQLPPKCAYTISNATTCTDTDGGVEYYIKGNVTGDLENSKVPMPDTCIDYTLDDSTGFVTGSGNWVYESKVIQESYCESPTRFSIKFYNCPNGCKDGACIQQAPSCSSCGHGIFKFCSKNECLSLGDCEYTTNQLQKSCVEKKNGLHVGDMVKVNGKKVVLEKVAPLGEVLVSVDGESKTIQEGATYSVNGMSITNEAAFYSNVTKERRAQINIKI